MFVFVFVGRRDIADSGRGRFGRRPGTGGLF